MIYNLLSDCHELHAHSDMTVHLSKKEKKKMSPFLRHLEQNRRILSLQLLLVKLLSNRTDVDSCTMLGILSDPADKS